ncbi:hypothetical protein KCU88_g185, partial [Aureobasidium melanogenum]
MLFRKHSLTLCLQKKALEETKAMIPTLRERITSAREKLESYLVRYITFRACNYVVLRHALALASAPFVLSNPASPFNRKEPRAVANANHFPQSRFVEVLKQAKEQQKDDPVAGQQNMNKIKFTKNHCHQGRPIGGFISARIEAGT